MTVVYQTSDVCQAERCRYWADALSRTFVPLEVRESAEHQFSGKLASAWLGQALVSELSSRPQACVRTDDTIRKRGGRNLLQVGLLLAGRADVTQDGRTARLSPGGLVIYETSRSFRWSFPAADWDLMIATFPRAGFAFSAAQSRDLTARDLSSSGAAGPILAAYLRGLREQVTAPDARVSARLGDTAADLVTTTMLEILSDPGMGSALDRALCQKVVGYVEDNLGDPGLTPARIAEAHYISRRYLYTIFTASQKMPVLEWIRLRRLERCRRALLDPAMAETPVGRIAARWGMPNLALFSRGFKRMYGLSPSAYRQHYAAQGRYAEGPQSLLPAANALPRETSRPRHGGRTLAMPGCDVLAGPPEHRAGPRVWAAAPLSGSGGLAMTVSAINWAPDDFSPPPPDLDKVVVRAACPQDCPDTCAMLVTVENGRATEVVGAPEHPFTRGALCVKINNFLDKVYSPDRLQYPMRRVGPKGAGRFERVAWDEALDEITGRFQEIIRRDGAQAILPFSYLGTEGLVNGLNVGDAFFNKMGATISERTFCDSGVCTAYLMTVGPTPGCEPESIINSKYIILWANNAISTNVHLWPIVRDAQRRGAKLVVIDPVANRTAQHADWHIKIRPGTDGALALAMINVIITENLTDEDYVRRYTVGYDALAERARQYTPEWAAEETGVPAADIRRLAREFVSTQPSVIRIGVAIERHPNGGQTVRAIACLPALAGSWRRPGGGLCQIPLWSFPVRWNGGPDDVVSHPDLIEGSPRVLNQFLLGPALTGELDLDPPIKGLFVYNCNPLVVVPSQQKVVAGLMRDDLFTVVSEHFQTDTADFADFVLPATTQLEQLDLMFSWGHLYLTLNTPSIEPLAEAIPNAELFRRLAARMGYQEACFSRSDEELARDSLDWSAPVLDGIDMEYLKAHGYARLKVGAPETFAPHAQGNFPTPSGKCELESSMARDQGNMVLPLFRQGYTGAMPSNPVDPLPCYTPRRESPFTDPELAKNYPLSLLTPKPHAFLNSTYGNLPRHRRVQGGQILTVNPADAGARGIADGQRVKVFNQRGAFYAKVAISEEVPPGIVMSPMGQWRKYADEKSTVHAVIEPVFADLGNAPAFSDIAVQVAMADGE